MYNFEKVVPLLKQPVQDVFLDLLFCRKPLLTSTVDCTWEAAVTQLVLGADSALDNTSLQFLSCEAVKQMVDSCNVQGIARFDGQKLA